MELSYSAGGAIVFIEFDGTEREQHDAAVHITDHPVEKGVDITDHVRVEPEHLTIDALLTNHPIRVPKTNIDGANGGTRGAELTIPTKGALPIGVPILGAVLAGAGVLDGTMIVKANVLQFDGQFDRLRSVYQELLFLQASATLVAVSTSLREYDSMIIESLSAPRTPESGSAMAVTIVLRRLRFAETKTVAAPAAPVNSKKVSKGRTPPKAEGPHASVLYKLLH